MARVLQQDIEYVDVRSGPGPDRHEPTSFYDKWLDQSSAKHANPELVAADTLRRIHPGYSLVLSEDHRLSSLFALPGITTNPLDSKEAACEQVSNVVFTPTPSHIKGKVAGSLVDSIIIGSYRLTWSGNVFLVYVTRFQNANFLKTVYFILHDGPEQPARDLVLATCLYTEQARDEVWVFNKGFWSKSKSLWSEIKDSSWNDVVMKEESKKALQKDIYGFFRSEMTYKRLTIPWKRGLIMYGPPGNGRTISIKVIMKTCTERGFTPLYVKSFQNPQGEEVAMQNVFLKTRQLAPCVLILEDLDSLINDRNRSFFLNELDGLEGHDGLLVIASTNHFDRLDPGLSNRPSRFDRKYLFDDPDYQERMLYAQYWREKLKDNDEISFPESLVEEVADLTQGFSFAYLKEAFVSTLVRITSAEDDERSEFQVMLKNQIMALLKELGEESPAHILPHPLVAQPEKMLDNPSLSLPTVQGVWNRPTSPSSPRITGKVSGTSTVRSGTTLLQGVLHAPPSAYPQVMPGSLYTRPEPLQEPKYTTRSVDIGRKSAFPLDNLPSTEIHPDIQVTVSPDIYRL